ncbi:MAG: hypothetical protein ACK4SY_09650 [Pyrobaculum sp.]
MENKTETKTPNQTPIQNHPQPQPQEDFVDMAIRAYNVGYTVDKIAEEIGRYTNIWHVTSLPDVCSKDKELCDKLGIHVGQPPREGVVALDGKRGVYWDPKVLVKTAALSIAEKTRLDFGNVVRGIAYLTFLDAFKTAHMLLELTRFYHYKQKREKDRYAGHALQHVRSLRRLDPRFKLLKALDDRLAGWLVRRGKL